MPPSRRPSRGLRPAAFVVLALATSGCGAKTTATSTSSAAQPSSAPSSSAAPSNPGAADVSITDANGCSANATSFPAGPLTVNVSNKDATAVSEIELLSGQRIIGEKENLPPGFSGSFSMNLDPGSYTLYCPGTKQEKTAWTITGTAPSAASTQTSVLLTQGAAQYAKYVSEQVGYLVSTTKDLDSALAGTDLTAAQNAYMKARPYYEKIEPVAESFSVGDDNLDNDIDAREDGVPAAQWQGFHRIEKGLFDAKSLDGLKDFGDKLVVNVTKLQTLTSGLTYKPYELANGAQDLLDEVTKTKITGEEERYSHIDLLDFANNVEAAQQAFGSLQPALKAIDPSMTDTISGAFDSLNQLLNTYRTGANASGFALYTALTDADKQKLAAAVKAVQEPLSQVTQKVTNA
ncbi:MAG TPA: iron uptake system protein EfeO [Sporichthyaceae bacterium]|jgi:iron uptake system component EfeO|nr:iron uptake system protein EfeO [Sporichthyaceae bacterium]